MRLDRIDVYHVAMPLVEPWRTAYGEDYSIESILLKLTSGEDEAWGESTPFAAPCYSPEYAGGCFAVLRDCLAPTLIGRHIESAEELQAALAVFKGNHFAKAALDAAWWSLESVQTNKPLHVLWRADRDLALVGADFGVMDSLDDLLTAVGRAVDEGYTRVKLKFRAGWDLAMVEAVRAQHPKHPLHIDCNGGYTIDDAPLFQKLDKLGLAMIEQPLAGDDLWDHAQLQKKLETPICLDESITSFDRARKAVEMGACRYVNIKPGRVGGLTNAKRIHDWCRAAGLPCWVGGMLESAVGAHHCIALAMLDNFVYPADVFPSSRFYGRDLADPPIELTRDAEGRPAVRAATEPGNPSKPTPDRLRAFTRQKVSLVAATETE
ncbi:MAG: o-succinylbenzoate synthase [Planctomycetia bacterium]